MAQLRRNGDDFQSGVGNIQTRLESLRATSVVCNLPPKSTINGNLQQQNTNLSNRKTSVEDEVRKLAGTVTRLKTECQVFRNSAEYLWKELSNTRGVTISNKNCGKNLLHAVDELEMINGELLKNLEVLTKSFTKTSNELASLRVDDEAKSRCEEKYFSSQPEKVEYRIKKLKMEMNALRVSVKQFDEEMKSMQLNTHKIQPKLTSLQSSNEKYQLETKKLEPQLKPLEIKSNYLRVEFEAVQEVVETYKTKAKSLKLEIENLISRAKDLLPEIKYLQLQAKIFYLQPKTGFPDNQAEDLRIKSEDITSTAEDLKSLIDKLESDKQNFTSGVEKLQKNIEDVKPGLKTVQSANDPLLITVNNLQSEIRQLHSDDFTGRCNICNIDSDIKNLALKAKQLANSRQCIQVRVKLLQNNISMENSRFQSEYLQLKIEELQIKFENGPFENDNFESIEYAEELDSEDLESPIEHLESKLENITLKTQHLKPTYDNFQSEIENIQAECEKFQLGVKGRQSHENKLRLDIEQLRAGYDTINRESNTNPPVFDGFKLINGTDKVQSDTEELQSSITTLEWEIETLETNIEELLSGGITLSISLENVTKEWKKYERERESMSKDLGNTPEGKNCENSQESSIKTVINEILQEKLQSSEENDASNNNSFIYVILKVCFAVFLLWILFEVITVKY